MLFSSRAARRKPERSALLCAAATTKNAKCYPLVLDLFLVAVISVAMSGYRVDSLRLLTQLKSSSRPMKFKIRPWSILA